MLGRFVSNYFEGSKDINFLDFETIFLQNILQNIEKLKNVYAGVEDLDLYIGLALEKRDHKNYKFVGPVGKHILGEQLKRSKFGDRFFYCLRNNGNRFTLSNSSQ